MFSKRSLVQGSTLRHVSRAIQDITPSDTSLSAKVVSRPSLFFSGPSVRRNASTTPSPQSSTKTKPQSSKAATSILRDPMETPPKMSAARIANTLKHTSGGMTYMAYGATKRLFEVCGAQADYKVPQAGKKDVEVPKTATGEELGVGEGWWYTDIGLLPTFASWSQVTFLHMYLLTVRIRTFPTHAAAQEYSRHLVDHFSHEAERRMDELHGITARPIRVKYLKDLFLQWRGILIAYDEGLIRGDAVLGAAVWRNLFKGAATRATADGKEEEVDWEKIALVVGYMRRVIKELAAVDDAALVSAISGTMGKEKGYHVFARNQIDAELAKRISKGVNEPLLDAIATGKK